MVENSLHITVAAVPKNEVGKPIVMEHELRLAKASILYADKVKLCSLLAALVNKVFTMGSSPQNDLEKTEMFLAIIHTFKSLGLEEDSSVIDAEFPKYIKLLKRNTVTLTRRERQKINDFKKKMNEIWEPLVLRFEEHQRNMAFDEIKLAADAGLLDIQPFSSVDNVKEYFDTVKETLSSSATHPMLDDQTSELVRLALKEGKLTIKTGAAKRSKHTALVANLFDKLPVFDVKMDELLDLRTELRNPLIRFRAEIYNLSSEIDSAVWDEDFPFDVQDLYHKKIAPALLEIEEKLKSAGFRDFWSRRVIEKSSYLFSAGGFSAAIGAAIAPIAGIASAIAGLAIFSESGFADLEEKLNETKGNGLYFYYRMQKHIGKK